MEKNWCVRLFTVAGAVIALGTAGTYVAGIDNVAVAALLQDPHCAAAIDDMDNSSELDAYPGHLFQTAQEDYDPEDDDGGYLDNETEV